VRVFWNQNEITLICGLKFSNNARTNTLSTPDNMKRWKIGEALPSGRKASADSCTICDHSPATITHILSSCDHALGKRTDPTNRIKIRHDMCLETFTDHILPHMEKNNYTILIDLPHNKLHYKTFSSELADSVLRPDLILCWCVSSDRAKLEESEIWEL
jgi:hypothetical protein